MASRIRIRPLETLEELDACVRLQEETWGPGFTERVPRSILKIAPRVGGVTAGAFDPADELVGFVFGLTGLEGGEPVHWSDMLAVRPRARGMGLARRLKLWQRERCLELGVRRMYWSYDPLESRNAWLNLGRLGAVVREYAVDLYGPSDSPLHRGLGTDRLIALWRLDSPRVEARLAGSGAPPPSPDAVRHLPRAFAVEAAGGVPRPGSVSLSGAGHAGPVLVPIPADVQAVKAADPGLAVAWREATRTALAPRLAAGWEVRELVRSPEPVSYYLLERAGAAR